ncbi:hypothetical protein MFIFM68171_11135 [Madurella fahalii]|uniref:Uncharacterized protein n=1 Tax=Madurella fahalii TaxID=1157608 RepID=A0ABQ0GT69_9PEZI
MTESEVLTANVGLLTRHLNLPRDDVTRVLLISFYIYLRDFLTDHRDDAQEPDLAEIEKLFAEGESQPKSNRLWLDIKTMCKLRPSKSRREVIKPAKPSRSRPVANSPWVVPNSIKEKEGWAQNHHAAHFVAWAMFLLETQDYYGPGGIANRETEIPRIHRWLCLLQSVWLTDGIYTQNERLKVQLKEVLQVALKEVGDRAERGVCSCDMLRSSRKKSFFKTCY